MYEFIFTRRHLLTTYVYIYLWLLNLNIFQIPQLVPTELLPVEYYGEQIGHELFLRRCSLKYVAFFFILILFYFPVDATVNGEITTVGASVMK